MKKYIVTEQDIERLQEIYSNGGDSSWWYNAKMDEWEKTLNFLDGDKVHTIIAPKVNYKEYL